MAGIADFLMPNEGQFKLRKNPLSLAEDQSRSGLTITPNPPKPMGALDRIKGLFSQVGKGVIESAKDPGFSGALGHIAMALAPKGSWQYNLGELSAAKAKAEAGNKYATYLEKVLAGDNTAKNDLTPLQIAQLDPELRSKGMEAIIAGKELGLKERQVSNTEQQTQGLLGYYESENEYRDWLKQKPEKEQKNFAVTEMGIPGQPGKVQKVFVDLTSGQVGGKIGEPYDQFNPNAGQGGSGANAEESRHFRMYQQAEREAQGAVARAGFGKLIQGPNGLELQFTDPVKGQKIYQETVDKRIQTFIKAGLLPAGYLGMGDANPGNTDLPVGVTVTKVLPSGERVGSDGNVYPTVAGGK
jgi:hypothetical protein